MAERLGVLAELNRLLSGEIDLRQREPVSRLLQSVQTSTAPAAAGFCSGGSARFQSALPLASALGTLRFPIRMFHRGRVCGVSTAWISQSSARAYGYSEAAPIQRVTSDENLSTGPASRKILPTTSVPTSCLVWASKALLPRRPPVTISGIRTQATDVYPSRFRATLPSVSGRRVHILTVASRLAVTTVFRVG